MVLYRAEKYVYFCSDQFFCYTNSRQMLHNCTYSLTDTSVNTVIVKDFAGDA